jgi:hypothetical protein
MAALADNRKTPLTALASLLYHFYRRIKKTGLHKHITMAEW